MVSRDLWILISNVIVVSISRIGKGRLYVLYCCQEFWEILNKFVLNNRIFGQFKRSATIG
jgi:hypothetical protein